MVLTQTASHHVTSTDLDVTTTDTRSGQAPIANISVRGFMDPAALDARTAFYTRFLDVLHSTDGVRACHRRTREVLAIGAGYQLLDVGCGTGHFACEAAALVGATGHVVGVDLSPALLAVARERAAGCHLPVTFQIADAQALPFPDNTFDGCRVERVLQYVDDPARALAEMVRVTRPGGCITAAEVDWDTIVEDLPDIARELYRRKTHAISDSAGNGWMGRQVRRRLLECGLADVTSEGFVAIWTNAITALDDIGRRSSIKRIRDAGAITDAESERLIAAVEAVGTAESYLAAFTLFLVSGRKPA